MHGIQLLGQSSLPLHDHMTPSLGVMLFRAAPKLCLCLQGQERITTKPSPSHQSPRQRAPFISPDEAPMPPPQVFIRHSPKLHVQKCPSSVDTTSGRSSHGGCHDGQIVNTRSPRYTWVLRPRACPFMSDKLSDFKGLNLDRTDGSGKSGRGRSESSKVVAGGSNLLIFLLRS